MNPSKLRFSIEESVWLKKGQEVAEVLSMALEPDIQITEEGGQVCVKGALMLHGEYRPCAMDDGNSLNLETGSLREQVSYRSLTQLKMNDEGIAELDHRFPVDITIPSTRVQKLEEVFVLVDAFDYELPNPTCLELTASISISGIQDGNEEPAQEEQESFQGQAMEDEGMTFEETPMNEETEYEPFQVPVFEARFEENEQQDEMNSEEEARTEEQEIFAPFQFESKKLFEMPIIEPESEPAQAEFTEPAINYNRQDDEPAAYPTPTFDEAEAMEEQEYQQEYQEEYQEETADNGIPALKSLSYYTPSYIPPAPPAPPPALPQIEQINIHSEEQEAYNYNQQPPQEAFEQEQEREEEQEKVSSTEARKEENALYLTKMLSGNEDRFSKVKMYIIQRGESLDSICERYDISIHSLMRVNRINQEEIAEGQIIYIPVSQSR
ncbi:stage VI sporulation protein D [Fictibacillus sp. KIGAM418]|uniref:Stage VI sporulation protein D n=1 Tax=Fictibacillus marinisediminis TaxID=2878389 RepID=A0A9X1XF91_9BACL|nr:stage VI sporulation protein D [Fictibacillus marinisediminis]MCK6257940.1 stage VI sporulation protein D [Fictibacillus marinisediminis]